MALSSKISDALFGGRSQAFLSDGLFDLVLDVVKTYTENDSSKITIHTIEDGADIADHIDDSPKSITISAIITDDDWDILDPSGFFDDTIEDRFQTFEYWKTNKMLLTYYGHETDIEDVVLTNFTRNKNLDTGAGWGIDISLQQVTIASYTTAAITLSAITQRGTTSRGTSSRAGSATTQNRSILNRLIN